jgi:hypothetical protein
LTINQIYSGFRIPHHVAPFSPGQLRAWLPGIGGMAAATCLVAVLARQEDSERRVLARWLLVMYAYLILAFVLSYFDRHTYLLGPFILFRPNSLVLVLTIMLGVLWLRQALRDGARTLTVIMLAVAIGFVVPRAASLADTLASPQLPLTRTLTPTEHELIGWLRGHTPPDATVVIEPTEQTDWTLPWLAFERLIDRPTLVSFKFVPTYKADIARWYRLVRWRKAVFEGDCGRVSEQPADYLVTLNAATLTRVAGCGDIVWAVGTYGVVRTARGLRSRSN